MKKWTGPEYHVTAVFRAPLPYVFEWCTDFQSDDARLEQEGFERKILERTSRRIVYEDLEWAHDGWHWAQYVVTLSPPNRWHAESVGNYRDATLDYVLTEMPRGRTRLDLTWRRRRGPKGARVLPKQRMERDSARAWRSFARALEHDYQTGRAR
jgi:hypothetical protein